MMIRAFLFAFLFLSSFCPPALSTTYFVAKLGGIIVAGADSCSTLTIDHSKRVRGPDVCKFYRCTNHAYFVMAATPLQDVATGINFARIAASACSDGGSMSEIADRLSERMTEAAKELYEKTMEPAQVSAAIFGADANGAFLLSRAVRIDGKGIYSDPVDDCMVGCEAKYTMGGYHGIMERILAEDKEFWDKHKLVGGVKYLLTEEITANKENEVAFPISVLQMDASGERWIERGVCQPM